MASNLTTAALIAGLSDQEKKNVEALSKALDTHQSLLQLPQGVAQQQYSNLPADQQQALTGLFGNEDPSLAPQKSFLGTAFHYAGQTLLTPFKIASWLSDQTTRAYRTGALAVSGQAPSLVDAWKMSGATGEKTFNQNRIDKAKAEFGDDEVAVAMAVASGTPLQKLTQGDLVTPAQQAYAALISKPGKEKEKFQNILDAVQAAKYSPGRQIANFILPGQLEGSGLFYRPISGAIDAAYRVFADPTLALGKAVKMVNVMKYSLDVMMGGAQKTKWWQAGFLAPRTVDEVFSQPSVVNFWDTYGAELAKYRAAKEAGETAAQVAARDRLKTIAPEFGPAVIDEFNSLAIPIKDAATAKGYFQNSNQVLEILKGQPGRPRVLMPRLDLARKTRIAALTTGRKVFNFDQVGPKLVQALYFGNVTNDGIVEKLTTEAGQKEIVQGLRQLRKTKKEGIIRYSSSQIQYRLDRFRAKFEYVPFFPEGAFDVMGKDAGTKVYQLARTSLPGYYSKSVQAAFEAADEGARKEIFYGLWNTIADFRGLNVSTRGAELSRQIAGKGAVQYAGSVEKVLPDGSIVKTNPSAFGPDGESMALIPSQLSSFVSAPSIKDIDNLASRDGIFKIFSNLAHSDWVDKMTSYWSFLTLAGPRYATRNAIEDLMVHLAVGNSPWGLVKGRMLSTKVRTLAKYDAEGNIVGRISADPLGVINRVIRSGDRKRYDALIKNAQGDVEKIREIYATAVTESKLARFGITLNQEDAKILADQIRHGNLDNALADVVEGGKNSFTGTDFASRALNQQRRWGRVHELNVRTSKNFKKVRGRGYSEVAPTLDEASQYAWLMQINFWANDKLGRLAVAHLDDEKKAVGLIKEWLNNNPYQRDRFRLYSPGIDGTVDTHAQAVYDAAKQLFVRSADDTINMDLLSKVRAIDPNTGEYRISGDIGIGDLPQVAADAPKSVLGPTLIPVADSDNYAASLMSRGWDWMGEQNARFSREPMVYQEIITVRKQMRETGFEDAYIKAHTAGITDPKKLEKATANAKAKIADIAEQRAKMRVLAFVDNPLIQTQLAFNIRNFARFYRATEDFSRRIVRAVRYNPEAIARASLTYEGITHSGWVQQDDNGDSYFIYPGTATAYKAMQGMMTAFGIPAAFKVPMPVEFGAKLNMITPSLNPDSIIPTFAGPLAAVSVKTFENIMNVAFDNPAWADTVTRYALGKYAQDQPMISALLPAHVNKVYALLNRDERNSQYASAVRKGATYLEASGHGIPERYDANGNLIPPTAGELEDYRLKLKNSTITVLALRAFAGLVLPASPQIQLKSDMAEWVRDNGSGSFKQVFNKMLADNNGDIDKTTQRWIELFPKEIPYTITESDRSTVALVRYASESGQFVEQNADLFKAYPEGAAFLIPYKGDFSWDAYRTMSTMGLRTNKRVDDFVREIQSASALQTYYSNRNNYLSAVATAFDPYTKKDMRDKWQAWSDEWKATHPLIQEELAQGGQRAIARQKALVDLGLMLSDNSVRALRPKAFDSIKAMYDTYNNYISEKGKLQLLGSIGTQLQDSALSETIFKMEQIAATNSNAKAAYDILFSRLLD